MMVGRVYQKWDIFPNNDNEADAIGLAYIAKAIHAVKTNATKGWHGYEIAVAEKVLGGE